jgi:uncharacterized YccA/Bax inhibitor family protein
MALMKTSNPALGQSTFGHFPHNATGGELLDASARMTINGTINKTGILLLCSIATAALTWNRFLSAQDMNFVGPAIAVGAIGGLVLALVTVYKKEWSRVTAPVYALLEGLMLGGISAIFEIRYPGIGMEAVALTFGTLLVMLLAYKSGLIEVTQRLRMGIVAATGAIFIFYLLLFVLSLLHLPLFSAVYGSGMIGLIFSFAVVGIAALNLVLDFDFIERGAAAGAPKYMEWYAAFGLMVTLVWLYIEMLRLLVKMRSRG